MVDRLPTDVTPSVLEGAPPASAPLPSPCSVSPPPPLLPPPPRTLFSSDPPSPAEVRTALLEATEASAPEAIAAVAAAVPPSTFAAVLPSLPAAALRCVLAASGPERLAEVAAALDPAAAVEVLLHLSHPQAADVLEAMDPDDAADVVGELREMAVGEVAFQDLFRVWRKEVATGLLLGAAIATAMAVRAWTLSVPFDVGLTVAVTAGAIVLWSTTVAAVLPLMLRQLRIDPAVVSAPLITTLVDGTGLLLYFEIARLVLRL